MKSKKENYMTIGVFVGFLLLFLLLALILPDKSFSERENRYLQTLPQFSFKKLASGEFTADFEDYCADQFPLRDAWITLNARYEQFTGKQQTNGVFLCGDRLITPFTAPTEKELKRRRDAVAALRDAVDIPVTLGLIPDAAEIFAQALPDGAPNDSQAAVMDAAEADVPLLEMLKEHSTEDIFYRTDHHWTTLGAYYGYVALCASLGLEPQTHSSFTPETVSTDFYGTSYSSSGYTWIEPDCIERYVDESAASAVVSYRSGSASEGRLYCKERLVEKDQYTYFLGGNSPELVITGTDESLPRLLMIRDSYSDCLVPFLLAHFSEIRMLDLRYYLGSVKDYAEEHGADQILILYSVKNFCSESSVLSLAE